MKRPLRSLIAMLFCLAASASAIAQLPQQVPYQGVITLPAGSAAKEIAMHFSIWDAQEGGKKLWEELQPQAPLSPGENNTALFSVMLGSVNRIPLKEKKPYWLEVVVDADTLPRVELTMKERERATDTSLTQKFASDFGYSVMLPATFKFNKLGSAVNLPGETEKQNYIIPGGKGSAMIYYVKEGRMVPRNFQMLDGVHYYEYDSLGRNGTIYRRVYILKDYSIQIDVLLTDKGKQEYADRIRAIFDSFVAPPNAVRTLEAWRYGRNPKDFEQGRYKEFGGPGR